MSGSRVVGGIINNDLFRLVIAVVLLVGTLVIILDHQPPPDALWGFDGLAVGFYFGGLRQAN